MITEGIISTKTIDGKPHFSAMGPVLDLQNETIELRPFQPSTTLQNLQYHPFGVFHLIDDATLFAKLILEKECTLDFQATPSAKGFCLMSCVRWFEFEIKRIDLSSNRANVSGFITGSQTVDSFQGFNRAHHAILEASILATRIDFVPMDHIKAEYVKLEEIVNKTGRQKEVDVMQGLVDFISR